MATAAAGTPAHPCLAAGADCTLREIADAAGVRIGTATQPHLLNGDPRYTPTLLSEFNSITAENQMKWQATEPSEGGFDFAGADALVDFARANDLRMRGHTLLWANPERIPDWVEAPPDAATLHDWLDRHIRTVVERYADDLDSWDVVNEPLQNFSDTELYDNVFFQNFGVDYIAEAFRIAHEADPDAKLFLNEVLAADATTARFDTLYQLVSDLIADGVPIHGVGFQGHLIEAIYQPDPAAFTAAVQAFADLGLSVEITELDLAMFFSGVDGEDAQRQLIREFMGACLSVLACDGVTFWGFTDAHTWIDSFIAPGLIPLPFDEEYLRKPLYLGARDALLDRLARVVPEPGLLPLFGFALFVALAHRRTR